MKTKTPKVALRHMIVIGLVLILGALGWKAFRGVDRNHVDAVAKITQATGSVNETLHSSPLKILRDQPHKTRLALEILATCSDQELGSRFELCLQELDESGKHDLISKLLEGRLNNEDRLFEILNAFQSDELVQLIAHLYAKRNVSSNDLANELLKASRFHDDSRKNRYLSTVLGLWADLNPHAITSFYNSLEDKQMLQPFVPLIAGKMAHDFPLDAAKWMTVMEPEAQLAAMPPMINEWSQKDPYECSKWLNDLPQGEVRDIGSLEMVRALVVGKDIDSAQHWADSITDETLKAKSLRCIKRGF